MEMDQAGDILWQSNEDLKEILVVGGVTVHFPDLPQVSLGRQMAAPGL